MNDETKKKLNQRYERELNKGERFWPDAPTDTYGAMAGSHNVAMAIPSLDLVVVWYIEWRKDASWDPDMNQALRLLVQSAAHTGPEPNGRRETPERTTPNRSLRLGVRGDQFYLDERPFDMWGVRVASATKDAAQADHLIAQLDDYRAHGVNAVAIFYMGSSGAKYDPFSPDGLDVAPGHEGRMERIIQACAARNMVVIVGLFYQHAPFGLRDAEAVRNAVRTVTRKLRPYRNLVINVANEQNSGGWGDTAGIFDFRDPARVIDLCETVHQEDPDRLVGGGGYDHARNKVIGRSPHVDVLLFDTDGPADSGLLYDEFVAGGVGGQAHCERRGIRGLDEPV